MSTLKVQNLPPESLKQYPNNPKEHDDEQIAAIAKSIIEFGFVNPILIDSERQIIAGHGRYLAALQIGMDSVPTIAINNLTKAQIKALRIADNRLAQIGSRWNAAELQKEYEDLLRENFDLDLTGFSNLEWRDIAFPPDETGPKSDDKEKTFDLIICCHSEDERLRLAEKLAEMQIVARNR